MDGRLDDDGMGTATGHDAAARSRVAGFRVMERIGAGGMAVVFRARDERLGRLVALKVLAPALASDEGFRRRFIRESRAAATVEDPHIIPVYEAGEASGQLFIAMRYVSGGDVRTQVRRDGLLSPGRAAAILSAVASALDAAHAAGLVHRDVKPANMLLDARPGRPDHVYLSDFGLSKSALSSVGLTGSGSFLGTPDYASPEQIAGDEVDGRADQYALACVAFELLTGAPPFQRDHAMAVIYAHSSERPPTLSSRRSGLPVTADSVLATALAKKPADRFASCQDFTAALRTALRLAPYDAEPPMLPGPAGSVVMIPARSAPALQAAGIARSVLAQERQAADGGPVTDAATTPSAAVPARGRRLLRSPRLAVVLLAAALAVSACVQLGTSLASAAADSRVAGLASLAGKVTTLARQLELERDETVWFIALKTNRTTGGLETSLGGQARQELAVVRRQWTDTGPWITRVRAGVRAVGPGYPQAVVLGARSVGSELGYIPNVRTAGLSAQASAVDVISRYSAVIDVLLGFADGIGLSSNDQAVVNTVSALTQVARVEDEYSVQRGVIVFALTAGWFEPNMFDLLTASAANQRSDDAQFQNFASRPQAKLYTAALATGSLADRVSATEATVVQYNRYGYTPLTDIGITADEWFGSVTAVTAELRSVEQNLTDQVLRRAQSARRSAIAWAAVLAALVLLLASLLVVTLRQPAVSLLRRGLPLLRRDAATARRPAALRSHRRMT